MEGNNIAIGIIWSGSSLVTLNNVYNIGDIINDTNINNKYSIGSTNNPNNIFNNVYYLKGTTPSSISMGTAYDLSEIKNQTFVDILNKNIKSINLEQIDPLLKDYTLSQWTLGSGEYPTLINE